jgi:hypothetical protein
MSANLNGALPSGEANGLAAIARELVETPTRSTSSSPWSTARRSRPTAATSSPPPVSAASKPSRTGEDGRRMRVLLRREWERRTGKTVLPFELEEDMRAAFGDDPTGE